MIRLIKTEFLKYKRYNIFIVSTCCYIAVLPIIIITAGKQNRFLSGVIFSFFYGFCGIFLADRNLVNLYPMTTGLVLSNYAHDDKIISLRKAGGPAVAERGQYDHDADHGSVSGRLA